MAINSKINREEMAARLNDEVSIPSNVSVGTNNKSLVLRKRENKCAYSVMIKPSVREEARQFANQLNTSFSDIVEQALTEFIKNNK